MKSEYSFDADPHVPAAVPDLVPHRQEQESDGAAPAAADDGDDGEVHLLDYLRVVHKRRWTALTIFLIVIVSVVIYCFTATPIYEARVRVLIETENQNVVSFKAVVNEDQTKQDYYQTQYNILQSRSIARRTLDELKLWNSPPFGSITDERLVRAADKAPQPATPAARETEAESAAVDAFLGTLTVTPIRNSRLVDIKIGLPDPVLAARVVNAFAENYIEQNLEYRFTASKEASDWLHVRLAEQRKQVEEAEAKLQRYREQNDAISLKDRENIVVQKLSDLNTAVTQAKTERFEKEALYNQLQSLRQTPGALDTFPAILTNTFVQQQKADLARLQSQYAQLGDKLGPNHPDMVKVRSAMQIAQAKLDGEIGNVVQSVKNEYASAMAKEESLINALNGQKSDALTMNRRAIEYGVLERDIQSSRQLYESLLQRAKEAGITTELRTSNIRVVDRAETPRKPVSPQKGAALVVALFCGAVLACGVVFFLEYIDDRIKTPDEIKTHLGMANLGLLPAINVQSINAYPLVNNGVAPNFSEALRTIRTNLLFACPQERTRTIVVTSTGPGEGKSLVASNLAILLAQAGQRVLFMDADLRKPQAQVIFGIDQEPGLSNLIVGDAKAKDCVRQSSIAGLWLLAAGRIPPNPAELLGAARFRQFLTSLKEQFEWVIIDSPPVMAVTDAVIAAHSATGVLFVVGAEMTSRHAAKRAVAQLGNARATLVGAVLNRVDLEHNAYYYSQYYRREYGACYQ